MLVRPREGTLKPETVLLHPRLPSFLSALNTEAAVGLAAVVCPVTVVVNVCKCLGEMTEHVLGPLVPPPLHLPPPQMNATVGFLD